MSETLYDIDTGVYPKEGLLSFRVVQIFDCPICETLTNLAAFRPNYGIRTVCPISIREILQ